MSYLAYITICSVVVAVLFRIYLVGTQLTIMLTKDQCFKNSAIGQMHQLHPELLLNITCTHALTCALAQIFNILSKQ